MSAFDCYQLVALYTNWLKEKTNMKTIGDICELTTPERVLRTIYYPVKNNVSAMIFSWDDARKVRAENSIAIAMLNGQDKEISPDTIHALKAYDIEPLLRSKRDKYVEKLAA